MPRTQNINPEVIFSNSTTPRVSIGEASMDIETSNAVKLFFPNPSLQQVYFEAIANSLDAGANEISIEIQIDSFKKPESLEIRITDNGSGFTNESFTRFERLLKPQDSLHKGLGRLVFLNYFKTIEVESIFNRQKRTFIFSDNFKGENRLEELDEQQDQKTTLRFSGFAGERVKSHDYLRPTYLKDKVIEQFLPYLHQIQRDGKTFEIKLDLLVQESNEQKDFFSGTETITVDDLHELNELSITDPTLDTFDGIKMFYRIKEGMGEKSFLTAFSIDSRTIPIHLIKPSSIPPHHSALFLFESKLFTGKSDTSRQKMVLPEEINEADLFRALRREIGLVLANHIPQIEERNSETKGRFEEKYPHLLGYFEDTTVGLIEKEDALEIAQKRFFNEQKVVLGAETLSDEAYRQSLDLSSRTLTQYILYRELIIRKMREMNEQNSEAEIHNLIVPRWETFDGEDLLDGIYRNNAWLLDDKFMTFQTILSEQKMDNVIQAITLEEDAKIDDGRPDIAMIFSADPEATPVVDVVVVEIKKKSDDEMRNSYAVNQLLDRAQKLVELCPNIGRIWYYAVMQVNDELASRLRQMNWAPLYSSGQVFYQDFRTEKPDGEIAPTSTFVISFDAVVEDAESRNHTFLEILRKEMKDRASTQTQDQ